MSVESTVRAQRLQVRAQLAGVVMFGVQDARDSINSCMRDAEKGGLDVAVMNDLRECMQALRRAERHVEQCRTRLQRKAVRVDGEEPTTEISHA